MCEHSKDIVRKEGNSSRFYATKQYWRMQNVDWDALLRSPAAETALHHELSGIQLGQIADGIENLDAELPPGVTEGSSLAPGLRDVRLAEVIAPVIQGQETSTLNVAQCLDLWSRGLNTSEQYCPATTSQPVIQGSVLHIQLEPQSFDEEKEMGVYQRAERQRKRKEKQQESVRRKMSAHTSGSDMVPIPSGVSQVSLGDHETTTDTNNDGKKSSGPRRKRSVKSDERAVCPCVCVYVCMSQMMMYIM